MTRTSELANYQDTQPDTTSASTYPAPTRTTGHVWRDTGTDGEFPTLTFSARAGVPPFDTFDIFRHDKICPLETGQVDYEMARYRAALHSRRVHGAIVFIYYGGIYFWGDPGRRVRPLAAFRHGRQIHCPIRLTPADAGVLQRMRTADGRPFTPRGTGDA